ncbi:MAG: proline--tRNA ligase [Pseudanabaena sp. RU_4_16]|nr:proline--tRNA ligase [Pseudanabaena sp. RU_4_16]
MRLSQMLWVTLREDPAEAEIKSHKLLLRAGYIRRITSGVYAYLPLMWRVLQKISGIVREEMNATGAQECLLPQLQPAELWQESGRWDTYTQAEGIMFALTDRLDRELGLGPTHEEIITAIAREMIRSYRQLPLHLYQMQTKFRDEIRPRFGLMRGREFIMKDGYSFHTSEESLKDTYRDMDRAYRNIFTRCGLEFRAVDADSGAIGGSGSQEFMVLAEAGEDEVLYTPDGKYAANVEKAVSLPPDAIASPFSVYEKRHTPNTETIEKLCQVLQCQPTQALKQVLYQATYDNGAIALVLASIRADQEVNEVKLQNELVKLAADYQAKTILALQITDPDLQKQWVTKPLPLGYIAPDLADDYIAKSKQVAPKFLRLVDRTALDLKNFVTGSNETDYHVVGANWGEQFPLPDKIVDIRKARPGNRAIHDPRQLLRTARGIEVGHIFQLGTKYSAAMGATYTNEQGEDLPLVMGCYGLGVSRLAQSAIEQSHDKDGIIWPVAIAPYHAIISVPNVKDDAQMAVAEQLYTALNQAGIETLLDDRDERAGVKFKDADLVGIPFRIVTGRSIAEGKVELVNRATKETINLNVDAVADYLRTAITSGMRSAAG